MTVEITDENFDQYFFDIRKHKPQKDQVIACFTAIAELIDGPEKRDLMELLRKTDKAIPATQVMRKLLHSNELDSYNVPIAIMLDLLEKPFEEVARKPYKYTVEIYYYTKREYVPKSPHWTIIEVMNLKDRSNTVDGVTISSKVEL
jgi:hypothetical protein